jgi:tripeptidyl-peptidase-1
VTGYRTGQRGYPDLSLAGNDYVIVVNNTFQVVAGTSASAPVVAGMISLVNSQRKAASKPPMGFLNPFLYEKSSQFVMDITSGNNLCTSNGTVCCSQGFHAMSGW